MHCFPRRFTWLSLCLFVAAFGASNFTWWGLVRTALAEEDPAQEPKKADSKPADTKSDRKWVRLTRDAQGNPLALETAVVRYTKGEGDDAQVVDLIGAVHVADKTYYDQLNEDFKGYDALLYELVAPKGVKIKRGSGTSNRHVVGAIQNGMKNMLELEHQMELIDYTPENFVHADMTPEEFSQKMTERNESFFTMFVRMMGEGMARQSKMQSSASEFDLLAALFDKNRANKLKVIMAEQFQDMESMMVSLGGPSGSTIITERNKVALKVLDDQLHKGHKKIGIFYGAGHMADMDERLRTEFKLTPGETRWLPAWNLQVPQPAKKPVKK